MGWRFDLELFFQGRKNRSFVNSELRDLFHLEFTRKISKVHSFSTENSESLVCALMFGDSQVARYDL